MTSVFKNIISLNLAFAVIFLVGSCNNSGTTTTTSDSTSADTSINKMKQAEGKVEEVTNQAAAAAEEAMKRNPDSSFVVQVAAANMEEINMLQAGIDKGTNSGVKSEAKMMMKDHVGLKKKMEEYASRKSYTLPSDDNGNAAKELQDMSGKSSNDWDKAWADFMFNAHEKTIGKFEGSQSSIKDEELKTMIANTLPTLHSHLDMVKKLVAALNK